MGAGSAVGGSSPSADGIVVGGSSPSADGIVSSPSAASGSYRADYEPDDYEASEYE